MGNRGKGKAEASPTMGSEGWTAEDRKEERESGQSLQGREKLTNPPVAGAMKLRLGAGEMYGGESQSFGFSSQLPIKIQVV